MPPSRRPPRESHSPVHAPKPASGAPGALETWVCVLRAINVVGHGKLPMESLRALCAELGLLDPVTCIQSGNVVFDAMALNPRIFATTLETALLERFGVRTAAIFRGVPGMRQLVAGNPFPAEAAHAPAKLGVVFLRDTPSPEAAAAIPAEGPTGERLRLVENHLFIYFPLGMGQSKLNLARLDRTVKTPGTTRNWNTVAKLLSIAEARTA